MREKREFAMVIVMTRGAVLQNWLRDMMDEVGEINPYQQKPLRWNHVILWEGFEGLALRIAEGLKPAHIMKVEWNGKRVLVCYGECSEGDEPKMVYPTFRKITPVWGMMEG